MFEMKEGLVCDDGVYKTIPLCVEVWQRIWGWNACTLKRVQRRIKNPQAESCKNAEECNNTAFNHALSWCIEEIKATSDVANPVSGKRMMQAPDPSEWCIKYNMDCTSVSRTAISARHFSRALKEALASERWPVEGGADGLQIRVHKAPVFLYVVH